MSLQSRELSLEVRRGKHRLPVWPLGENAIRWLAGRAVAPVTEERSHFGLLGAAILATLLIVALFPQMLAPYNPNALLGTPLAKPSLEFWLGTNDHGQDLLSELIWSTRLSLSIGLSASLLATSLGLLIGLVAGYRGGYQTEF